MLSKSQHPPRSKGDCSASGIPGLSSLLKFAAPLSLPHFTGLFQRLRYDFAETAVLEKITFTRSLPRDSARRAEEPSRFEMNAGRSNAANVKRLGMMALILGAIAIGFGPIFVRFSECGPIATAFWRIVLPLPLMLAMVRRDARSQPTTGGKSGGAAVLAGVCFAADLALWHWAILLTSVSNATLETNLAVIFVPLLGWLLFRQAVSRRFVVAMSIALFGTVLLVGWNANLSAQSLKGDALGILSAIFYSGYLVSVKVARDRGLNTATLMFMSGVISSAILLPLAAVTGEVILPVTGQGWLVVLGLALFCQLIGQSLIAYALAALPASLTTVGLLLQPLTAAIAAWLFLGEWLTGLQTAGGVILLLGIWTAKQTSQSEGPRSPVTS